MLLTGGEIDAREAHRIGLVNAVVAPADLLPAARDLARRISNYSPLAVSACLAAVTRGLNLPIDEALAVEAASFGRTASTSDIKEGVTAFLERRQPVFAGK
jgi:enoyl-CoA hydratase/carnithine racemase